MTYCASTVYLWDTSRKELVEALLFDDIQQKHLEDYLYQWKAGHSDPMDEHSHWNWADKYIRLSSYLFFDFFSIECEEQTQALMAVNLAKRCRQIEQRNQHMIYVEYLEVAPWNRGTENVPPRFKLAGTAMIAAAIQKSFDEGFQGRIGLHSLPQSNTFYQEQCRMTDMGPDTDTPGNLHYFEMTTHQAQQFLWKEKTDET